MHHDRTTIALARLASAAERIEAATHNLRASKSQQPLDSSQRQAVRDALGELETLLEGLAR
ncbi:hypothetical protein [Porphyrobacter sp. GA68]|uniref:hypothetical protein n=1 Tax=Porphyrobacter sp. GA68 TaxID=2883480 RepID=UPI001D18A91C|nr:hypothetical protein [Porphyrobacter sp. GA68]